MHICMQICLQAVGNGEEDNCEEMGMCGLELLWSDDSISTCGARDANNK